MNLPNSFEFLCGITKCTAEFDPRLCLYRIEWKNPFAGTQTELITRYELEGLFGRGEYKMLSEQPIDTCKSNERSISINVNSVFTAAKFEVENNIWSKDKSIQEVVDQIHDAIANLLDKAVESWEYSFTGTGCWKVQFVVEDELHAMIEVLVDPAIGQNMYYVNIEDYWSQN